MQHNVLDPSRTLSTPTPIPLSQMSAQKTAAFTKTHTQKKEESLVDGEETGYYGRQRRHLLMLYQVQR